LTLEFLPHQIDGSNFLASKRRAGLFDDMGVGKTAQAIGAMDLCDARRIIVVSPAAVREVWKGELRKFSPRNRRVLKGRSIDDLNLWLRGKADVFLLSYEMAAKWSKKLQGDLFDVLVLDESHYLKNKGVARTTQLLGFECDGAHGLAAWAAKVWFLSGTPAPNDPADIWPFLRFAGGTDLTLRTFCDRYFKSRQRTYSASHTGREEMLPELRQAIKSCSMRRTKAEAGLLLPPIWLTTVSVDGDTAEIRALLRQHEGLEQAILDAIEQGGLSFLDAQHIATLRRLVGEAKAPAFVELVAEELEGGLDKIVIMGVHKRALEIALNGLTRRGFGCVHIDGSVGERDRALAVESFQRDSKCRVFLGNIRAAGTGLTLTAAADIVMLESSWTPADNAQALMRVHRIGQNRNVRARFITLSGSIDEVVSETVARKTAAIAKIGFSDGIGA
jgi:SNF2 family DNA or RNA helicase